MHGDLTTLERVKAYLGLSAVEADAKLSQFISSSSAWVVSQLGRSVLSTTYTETRDGDGSDLLILERWPVNAVSSLTVDGTAVPAAATYADSGYMLVPPSAVRVSGYTFTCGAGNISITYRAGYEVTQAATVPAAPGPYTVQTTSRYESAISATVAPATALTKVAGAPAAGQYAVAEDPTTGLATYTFNAAQASASVTLVYGTVPQDLEQAVIEHVALRFRDADRTGITSISGGGESAAYSPGAALAYINGVLDAYREWVVA